MNGSAMNLTIPEVSTNITTSEFEFLWIGILEISLLSCHFTFGLLTIVYVIWLIVTGTGNGVASEFFNLYLSVSEILFSLDSLFCILGPIQNFQIFTLLKLFFQGLGITGHPLFQCLMCAECYLAVVHPVTFLKYKPLRYRVICFTAVWIITLGSCLFCFLSKNCTYLWFMSIHLLIVFFIQMFCCLAVLRALKQSGPGERRREREIKNHTKRRAFYLILITTMNMATMYLPCTIVGLITVLTRQNIPALWYIIFCFVLCWLILFSLFFICTGQRNSSALVLQKTATVTNHYFHLVIIVVTVCDNYK